MYLLKKLTGISALLLLSLCSPVKANPDSYVTGGYVWFGSSPTSEQLPASQFASFFNELQALRYNAIITTETRIKLSGQGCAGNAAGFQWVKGFPGKLGQVLDAAHARGIKVYVGGVVSALQCGSFWEAGNANAVVSDIQTNLAALGQFGSHPAFAGWHIPDEPGSLESHMDDYYRRVTAALKAIANKPVLVAPYYFDQATPAQLASKAVRFRNATGVNVQVWQDSVGAAPENKLFYWSRPGYSTEQYYQALAGALGTSGLWANVELFNHGQPLFTSSPNGLTGGYRPASALRINQQLWSARSAGKRVAWLHQLHTSNSVGNYEARRLHGTYRAVAGIGTAQLLTPVDYSSYTWVTPPSASFPDIGYKLFDRRTADPRSPQDAGWIGIDGTSILARVRIDLGSSKRVDWVGVHSLGYPSWGIRSPVAADIYCGSSQSSLVKVASITAPFTQNDQSGVTAEEYVLGNRDPLGQTCRFLELRIPTYSNWLFISEIELARS